MLTKCPIRKNIMRCNDYDNHLLSRQKTNYSKDSYARVDLVAGLDRAQQRIWASLISLSSDWPRHIASYCFLRSIIWLSQQFTHFGHIWIGSRTQNSHLHWLLLPFFHRFRYLPLTTKAESHISDFCFECPSKTPTLAAIPTRAGSIVCPRSLSWSIHFAPKSSIAFWPYLEELGQEWFFMF